MKQNYIYIYIYIHTHTYTHKERHREAHTHTHIYIKINANKKNWPEKSPQCYYRRAGIHPRKISNSEQKKTITLSFIFCAQSSDGKLAN